MAQQVDGNAPANLAANAIPAAVPAIVNRLAVRTPPFWKINPRLWFRQIEGQFATAGIVNDLTKFNTIIGVIDSDILSTVSDLVLNPPANNIYDALKQRLIKQFTESNSKKLKILLQELQLGDMKPSDLIRKMRELACGVVGDDLLQELWIQRLPATMQAVLSSHDGTLDQLITIADKIFDSTQHNAIQTLSQDSDNKLHNVISQLSNQILSLKSDFQQNSRSRQKPKHSKSPHRSSEDDSEKFCWYHKIYKHKANKCQQPCSFIYHSENSEGRQPMRQLTPSRK